MSLSLIGGIQTAEEQQDRNKVGLKQEEEKAPAAILIAPGIPRRESVVPSLIQTAAALNFHVALTADWLGLCEQRCRVRVCAFVEGSRRTRIQQGRG